MIYALAASVIVGLATASNSFSAIFDAGNVDGYYQLRMVGGSAVYDWSLDVSNFTTSCDLSQGLTYHIHSYWTDEEFSSVDSCGEAGGHYDPYLACGPSSQDSADLCTKLGRTADQGYNYACSPESYAAGHLSVCEVGDLSGKFGRFTFDENGKTEGAINDPQPALASNFEDEDEVSKQWASIVVHCPVDNARLFCAKFNRDKCVTGDGKGC